MALIGTIETKLDDGDYISMDGLDLIACYSGLMNYFQAKLEEDTQKVRICIHDQHLDDAAEFFIGIEGDPYLTDGEGEVLGIYNALLERLEGNFGLAQDQRFWVTVEAL